MYALYRCQSEAVVMVMLLLVKKKSCSEVPVHVK